MARRWVPVACATMADDEDAVITINLFLDDVRNPPDDSWTVVRTAEAARDLLDDPNVTVERASLDHDLGECEECESAFPKHSYDLAVADAMADEVAAALQADADHGGPIPRKKTLAFQVVTSTCRHRMTGYDLVKWMAENDCWPKTKPTVHSQNPVGAANMRATIDRYFPSQEET